MSRPTHARCRSLGAPRPPSLVLPLAARPARSACRPPAPTGDGVRPRSCAGRRRRHDRRRASTAHDETVRLIGIDTPETQAPDQAGRVLRPGGLGAHRRAAARRAPSVRLERDVEARDRYGRLLAYVYRADDGAVREPRRWSQERLRRRCSPSRPNVAHRAELDRGRGRRRARPGTGPVAGRAAGHVDRADRAGSVYRRDHARRTPRLRARRPPAHHQLRRPRLVPRRQRRASTRACAAASPPAPR